MLSPRSFPPLDNQSIAKGSRDVYVRAQRGLLPPRASDMLAVRIGQLTAKVFHLLDLQPCRPLPWTFTICLLPVSRRTAAQWPACTLPCRRFAGTLAGPDARLGAGVGRYSFTVMDFHHLLLAGLPAHHCWRIRDRQPDRDGRRGKPAFVVARNWIPSASKSSLPNSPTVSNNVLNPQTGNSCYQR